MSVRVLLADDHHVVIDGLRELLSREPDMEVVGEACDGEQAIELAGQLRPDVLMLSVHMSRRVVADALRAGAPGYVSKTSRIEEVVRAVRAVAAGNDVPFPGHRGGCRRRLSPPDRRRRRAVSVAPE